MPEFQQDHNEMTSTDKLQALLNFTQKGQLLKKLLEDSILGGKGCSEFWSEYCQEISKRLWLPTKTGWQGSGLTLSNGYVNSMGVKSWFSTTIISAPIKNSLRISSQSFTVSLPDFTQLDGSKTKSKKNWKKKPKKPRHKKSSKAQASRTIKVRIYPGADLHRFFKRLLAATRFVYNRGIELLKNGFTGSNYDLRDHIKTLDLPQWVKDAPKHPKEYAIADAYDAHKRAKTDGGKAKFKSCRNPKQTIKFHQRNYKKGYWFPSLTKKFEYWATEQLPMTCDYSTQVSKDRGRWYACFPVAEEVQASKTDKVIALDPGVRTFLTGYDAENILEYGKADIGRIYRLCSHLDKLIQKISLSKLRKHKRRLSKASQRLRNRIRCLIDECHYQIANHFSFQLMIWKLLSRLILLPSILQRNTVSNIH